MTANPTMLADSPYGLPNVHDDRTELILSLIGRNDNNIRAKMRFFVDRLGLT